MRNAAKEQFAVPAAILMLLDLRGKLVGDLREETEWTKPQRTEVRRSIAEMERLCKRLKKITAEWLGDEADETVQEILDVTKQAEQRLSPRRKK
jgi:hypothetical protein